MSSIIVVAGPAKGDYYPLESQTVVVGRDAKCPIQILDDTMSRVHMQVRHDAAQGAYLAKDLKSVNGVVINDRPIADEVPLGDGDLIALGDTTLMFLANKFADRECVKHYKKIDERFRPTMIQMPEPPE